MKKTMIFTLFIMIIAFAGCGMNKEAKLEAKTETNVNDYIEEVVVEEPVVSEEYLRELEYNSQQNVYFGEH